MSNGDIDKAYVSPYDKFLFEFDAVHEKSESQLKEMAKYRRIFALRDQPLLDNELKELWGEF